MSVQKPIPKPRKKNNEKHFFMVAALAYYVKDEAAKQRHLNLLVELDAPAITSSTLGEIQQGLIKRICDENKVEATDVKDIVLIGTSYLGQMTSEFFHGK